jgi:signal transduction histidine kinase
MVSSTRAFDFLDWVGPHQLSMVLQARSRWRLLAAPIGPSEVRRTERWLATARVSLALSALFAVWMYPTRISLLHWLLAAYVLYSTGVMLLLKFHKHSTSAFRAVVHGADLLWPALIYLFPEGRNLFFVFFVFVLAAAAYRWGLWETIGTAAGSLALLWLESLALLHGLLAALDGFLVHHHWPKLGINVRELEPKRLFILSVCLLVMGWILGYLAEQHKLLRAELERASLADELHRGVLNSLLGLEMRLHALADLQEGSTAQELRQIQDILLEEARKLRELMQRVKPVNVDANGLRPRLMEIAQRFERDTGIRAKFVRDSSVVDIERSICGVVVRIVQEAFANVRKHSCATEVSIHLDRRDGNWQLTIEDNGVGFPYSGRFSQSELKASGRGPLVIIECVDSIGGELTLESTTGRGSRLEITIPRN